MGDRKGALVQQSRLQTTAALQKLNSRKQKLVLLAVLINPAAIGTSRLPVLVTIFIIIS